MKNLEFITTGNEILSGLTVDTNFSWAAEKFSEKGFIPSYHVSVADDASDLKAAFLLAAERSSFVIVTGGLGPTDDDLSAETAAEFIDAGLVFDESSLKDIEKKLQKQGRKILDVHRKQALFPEGAEIIKNGIGTSNGFKVVFEDTSFYFLPGVPREFKSMLTEYVLPDVLKSAGGNFFVKQKVLKSIGLGESEVASKLADLKIENADFSYRIKYPEIHLKLVAKSKTAKEADDIINKYSSAIHESLKGYIFTDKDELLEEVVADLLKKNSITISTAESCTGGLLANLLTDIPGSSQFFLKGVVSYTNEAKTDLLGVEENLFDTVGAVSSEVVEQMAAGIRRSSASDIGVGISGIAGPGGGTEDKPVGTVYIGIDYMNHVYSYKYNFQGTRKDIKLATAKYTLDLIRNHIIDNHK